MGPDKQVIDLRTTFHFKFSCMFSKIDTPDSFIVFFWPQKLVRSVPLKETKPSRSPDRYMTKFLTFDNLFLPLYNILTKIHSSMATAITFSRQNDVSRACTTQCWKNYPLSHTFMVWDQAPHQEKKKSRNQWTMVSQAVVWERERTPLCSLHRHFCCCFTPFFVFDSPQQSLVPGYGFMAKEQKSTY